MEILCGLHAAIGNVEECPHGWCAFWDRGGCTIEQLKMDLRNVDLAYHLLELREAMEAARSVEDAQRTAAAFGQVRPPGL